MTATSIIIISVVLLILLAIYHGTTILEDLKLINKLDKEGEGNGNLHSNSRGDNRTTGVLGSPEQQTQQSEEQATKQSDGEKKRSPRRKKSTQSTGSQRRRRKTQAKPKRSKKAKS